MFCRITSRPIMREDLQQRLDVAQILLNRLLDAGVLHLDHDVLAALQHGPVHLAERGGGEGIFARTT